MIVRGPLPERGYTVLQNELLRDSRLSWKARGLLAFLLSQPPGWVTRTEHLSRVAPDGRDAVRTGLRELEAAGYLRRWRTRTAAGRWEWCSTVYDTPQDPVDNSESYPQSTSENPATEKPSTSKYSPMKYLPLQSRDNSDRATSTLCTTCDSTGWAPHGDELVRCTTCTRRAG